MARLALGTVQFGLNYGVTNTRGELSDQEILAMLDLAHDAGITLFDTAADYGASQARLGQLAKPQQKREYVTKFSLPADGEPATVDNIYAESIRQLQSDKLYGLLFHKIDDLNDSRCAEAVRILSNALEDGIVSKIGVSVYTRADLELALTVFPTLNLVQLPANLLDLDLLESPLVNELKSKNVEIHVRSVFLQGLLLTEPQKLNRYFAPLLPALTGLHRIAVESGKSPLELILGKMRHHPVVDAVVVGATRVDELNEIARGWNNAAQFDDFELATVPSELLDPRNWPTGKLTS